MQFTVNQKDLKELLKKLSYFRYKSNMPLHSKVEMFVTDNNVVFREVTRNTKETAETVCACELNNVHGIDTDGFETALILLPFDRLKKYVNATDKNSEVTISFLNPKEENSSTVKYITVTGTFTLDCDSENIKYFPNHENFPEECRELREDKHTYTIDRTTVNYQEVAELLNYACDEKSVRNCLTAIKMVVNKDSITYVATDSHVLTQLKQTVDLGNQLAKPIEALVPPKVFSGLGHEEFNDYNKIIFSESETSNFGHIIFAKDNYNYVLVHYQLTICNEYPEIERIIPQTNTVTVTFDKSALNSLLSALKKGSIIDSNNIVNVILDKKKNTLWLYIPSDKHSMIQESFSYTLDNLIALNLQDKENYQISLSLDLLVKTLKAINFKNLNSVKYTISCNAESNLTPIKITNSHVADYVQVLAPVRVN